MRTPTGGWLDRYVDASEPSVRSAARDLGVRAFLPMLVLLGANLALGFAITGPGGGLPMEDAVNRFLQAGRTPVLDAVARAASTAGNAPSNIGACVVFMAVLWFLTRRWWVAILPGIALTLEAIVHAVTSTIVDRDRPAVEHLDAAQPTASFPSGHEGATLAQVLILLFLAHRLASTAARLALRVLGIGFVLVLGWSRLYLGMHHLSDVLVGVVNGIVCALLAWNYLRRSEGTQTRAYLARAKE